MTRITVEELINAAKEGKTVKCNYAECIEVVGKLNILKVSHAGIFEAYIVHEGSACPLILIRHFISMTPLYHELDSTLPIEIID